MNEKRDSKHLSRRDFLGGIAATTATLAAVGGLAGCAAKGPDDPNTISDEKIVPKETMDCDLCVVGAGMSGLVAAVQAGDLGLNVIVLESSQTTGGGAAVGVEGSFGIDSSLSKKLGIKVDKREILLDEMAQAQWRPDCLSWMDLMNASGENIDWLVKQGVEFNGVVDDYHGRDFKTFHWYKDGHASSGFVPQMTAQAKKVGAQLLFGVSGEKLIQKDDGTVTGIYALEDSGDWIQVNAKSVIIATGGYGSDKSLASRIGYSADRMDAMFPNATGKGYLMALAAGAKDTSPFSADQTGSMIGAIAKGMDNLLFGMAPQIPWINEKCERFYAEDNCVVNMSLANPPKWNQKDYFMIWDSEILANYQSYAGGDMKALINDALKVKDGSLYSADTISELAGSYKLDPVALQKFVDDYNAMCKAHNDTIFGKDPKYLQPLVKAPYYIAWPKWVVYVIVGGIATNRNCQVIDKNLDAIPGLYAIGVDGCMLYRNIYTIGTPGSCSGFQIYSGRTAVNHASENFIA